jgi:hypothetical protein
MEFANYMVKYGKSYTTAEEFALRKQNFMKSDRTIRKWNSNELKTHRLGHNKFSDWSEEEYQRIRPIGSTPR